MIGIHLEAEITSLQFHVKESRHFPSQVHSGNAVIGERLGVFEETLCPCKLQTFADQRQEVLIDDYPLLIVGLLGVKTSPAGVNMNIFVPPVSCVL